MNIRRIRRIRGGAVHTDTIAVMIFIRVARARKIYFRTSCEVVNIQITDRRYSFRFGHCFSQCDCVNHIYIYVYINILGYSQLPVIDAPLSPIPKKLLLLMTHICSWT